MDFRVQITRHDIIDTKTIDTKQRHEVTIEMRNTTHLQQSQRAKKDEFYTPREVIDAELCFYTNHFRGATVYCNCDDPHKSQFFTYFVDNFTRIGITKLIASCYAPTLDPSPDSLFDTTPVTENVTISASDKPYVCQVTRVNDTMIRDDGRVDMDAVCSVEGNSLTVAREDGSYDSPQSLELLDEADIVVTNPPFSLFRPFFATLVERNKKFLLLGNLNAVTYRPVIPYIVDGSVTLGRSIRGGGRKFYIPDDYPLNADNCGVDDQGRRYIRVGGVRWFTNMESDAPEVPLMELTCAYSPDKYPRYENCDAINVDRGYDIPYDYDGVMGVPISFLDKVNDTQFSILGIKYGDDNRTLHYRLPDGSKKEPYARLLIKRKQ